MRTRAALFSIHDVMPATLDATEAIAEKLHSRGIRKLTLLVVPDTGWDESTLQRLDGLRRRGADLAGHGWQHRIRSIRNLRHRLHSLFISRNVAEHLALGRSGVVALMQDCHAWFAAQGLPAPALYVPPAWAMGAAKRADLDALPYDCYETLYGIYDTRAQRFLRLPMIGFEADTALRAFACRVWNRLNLSLGDAPVRFSIHPRDFELELGEDLRSLLRRNWNPLYYSELLESGRESHEHHTT
ncbi:MAG: polysaccharide deacetylase family protein [Pseudomonadota bacterium]